MCRSRRHRRHGAGGQNRGTAAAVVLAADALAGGPTLALFRGDDLPTGVLLDECVCVP